LKHRLSFLQFSRDEKFVNFLLSKQRAIQIRATKTKTASSDVADRTTAFATSDAYGRNEPPKVALREVVHGCPTGMANQGAAEQDA
jgi:hypothetical protein